jgi:hypothetical protein
MTSSTETASLLAKVKSLAAGNVPIPPGTATALPLQSYVVRMTAKHGYLKIYFTAGPLAGSDPSSLPVKIIVPSGGCIISLELDTVSWNWEFVLTGDVSPVSLSATGEQTRYYNLATFPDPTTQKITKAQFNAIYWQAGAAGNIDHFNLFVMFDTSDGSEPLPIKIDPDIQNPGDPTTLGGH